MSTKQNQIEENFFFKTVKGFVPEMLKYILGAVIAFVILRTDVTALTKRIDALEQNTINRDLVAEKFEAVNRRIDGLTIMTTANSTKLDRLIERFIK
jgi:hypothetical protein